MKKAYNFNAGPCVLPQQAIDAAIAALQDFKGTGMPVISVSHRSKEWEETMNECRALWKELLNIPDNYEVIFLGGGASLQFLYVAMNLLENKAGYLETGVWAKKALKEAKGIGNAICIASSADKTYSYIPKGYEIPKDLDYFHMMLPKWLLSPMRSSSNNVVISFFHVFFMFYLSFQQLLARIIINRAIVCLAPVINSLLYVTSMIVDIASMLKEYRRRVLVVL